MEEIDVLEVIKKVSPEEIENFEQYIKGTS